MGTKATTHALNTQSKSEVTSKQEASSKQALKDIQSKIEYNTITQTIKSYTLYIHITKPDKVSRQKQLELAHPLAAFHVYCP